MGRDHLGFYTSLGKSETLIRIIFAPQSGCSSGGRVHVWGACGRRFKSCHPDYITVRLPRNWEPLLFSKRDVFSDAFHFQFAGIVWKLRKKAYQLFAQVCHYYR